MDNKDDFLNENEDNKNRKPSLLLLCLLLMFGIVIVFGLSFSAVKFMDGNQTINTIISRLMGDDNKDKYIITYVENAVDSSSDGKHIKRNGKIHIDSAKYDSSKNGGVGEVTYFEGLLMTTKNTFSNSKSTITYLVTIKNDSPYTETFYGLIFDKTGDVIYSISGLNNGDKVSSGETVSFYVTASYNGKDKIDEPITIESSLSYNFQEDSETLHITDAKYNKDKSTDGGVGEVISYEGLELTTNNKFESSKSTITYQVTIKNDSLTIKYFDGLHFNTSDGITYSYSGIKQGDSFAPGKSITFDVIVKYTGNDNNYPKEIKSSVDCNIKDAGIYITDASYNKNKSENGGTGVVEYYEGLMLTTKNTFENSNSKVAYEITIKNGSEKPEIFDDLIFNTSGNVKYIIDGIKTGDILNPGESKKIYLIVEPNGDINYPTTIESSSYFDFSTFTTDEQNGIYLLNQFPTKDEVGKLFEGTNYVYKFTLMVGKKTAGAYYEITAVPDSSNTLNPSYVKIYLQKNKQDVDFSYKNNKVKVFTDYLDSEYEDAIGKVIYKGNVTSEDAQNGKIEFVMRMWVSEDTELNQDNVELYNNKQFAVKVNIYAQMNEG